jgi:hypothetical protein
MYWKAKVGVEVLREREERVQESRSWERERKR